MLNYKILLKIQILKFNKLNYKKMNKIIKILILFNKMKIRKNNYNIIQFLYKIKWKKIINLMKTKNKV